MVDILSGDLLSDSRAHINSSHTTLEKRRSILPIIGHGGISAPSESVQGVVPVLDFAIADDAATTWAFEAAINRTKDATIALLFATEGAESGKKVSFDIGVVSLDSVAFTDIAVLTGTRQIVDVVVPTLDNLVFGGSVTIPAATFYPGSNIVGLVFQLKRVASSADPAAKVGVFSVVIDYEILTT